jgi:hypothetical protein
MGPYKAQIPVQDRWAIVAYVKALQETGITSDTPVAEDADADAATEGETEKSEEASEQVSEKEADKQEKPAATEDVTEQEKKDKDDH